MTHNPDQNATRSDTLRHVSLSRLVRELEHYHELTEDFVAPARALRMQGGRLTIENVPESDPEAERLQLDLEGLGVTASLSAVRDITYVLSGHAHGQLADRLGIHRSYYKKMRAGHLELLGHNVNYWLRAGEDGRSNEDRRRFLLRTFRPMESGKEGVIRALLSTRYSVYDNYHVLFAVLRAVKSLGADVHVQAADLTPSRMYVRVLAPEIERQAPELLRRYRVPGGHRSPGNPYGIISGFVLANSEVGDGGLYVAPRVTILACSNGLTITRDQYRRIHLGKRLRDVGILQWSEETRKANLRLIEAEVRDAVRSFLSPAYLGRVLDLLGEHAAYEVRRPERAIRGLGAALDLPQHERDEILRYFIQGGDTSAFGVAQAMTYAAHESADPDRQYKLEQLAVEALPLVPSVDEA